MEYFERGNHRSSESKAVLNMQESAEVIVSQNVEMQSRTKDRINRSLQYDPERRNGHMDVENKESCLQRDSAERKGYDRAINGYRLEHIYKLKFTNPEILAICKILLDSRALTKKEMESILAKLIDSCVPEENQKLVKELIKNEEFHYIEPRHHTVFIDKMWLIGQAIQQHKYIEIEYQGIQGSSVKRRKLKPLAIMFSEYYFYMCAFIDDKEVRANFNVIDDAFPTIYRLDRIQSIQVLEEHYNIPYTSRFEEGEFRKRIDYYATTYEGPKCKETEDPQFIKDEGTPSLIPGSYVSSGLAAHVMYYKYVMSMPLYRQEKDFEYLGAKISRTTMASWIIYCAENYFRPMYEYLHRKLLKRRYLMADETPIQVLKEEGRRPQSKSYVWLVRTGDDGETPIILYNYTPTRAGKNAAAFLAGADPGYYLMVDGYQGYNKVPDAQRCCCWAHIRRYWLRAIPKGHEKDYKHPAVQGFLYCNKLFEYERSYREKGLSLKQIYNRRLKDQKPVIEAFLSWLDQLHPESGDRLISAINYSNGCRPYMMNYLKDGACSLSNNLSENSIRPLVVGRKNWLFSDTPSGADASMKIYSMIETAKANELDPHKYLSFLLEHRPSADMSDFIYGVHPKTMRLP